MFQNPTKASTLSTRIGNHRIGGAAHRVVQIRHCPVASSFMKTCCKTKGLDGSLPMSARD